MKSRICTPFYIFFLNPDSVAVVDLRVHSSIARVEMLKSKNYRNSILSLSSQVDVKLSSSQQGENTNELIAKHVHARGFVVQAKVSQLF